MKKSKLLLVLVVSVLALTVGLTACNKKPTHSHTYSADWTYDETNHWHAASCEHSSEVADKAEHTFGNWETVTAPTYTQKGSEKRECSLCHYAETRDIAKLEQEEGTFVLNTTTKEYDGNAVDFEEGTNYTVAEDYDGAVVFKFYSDEDATAEVTEVVNAGVYYVVATLAATDKYEAYTSAPIEFTVTQATNTWTTPLTIEGWTYGDEPNAPSAVSKFGNEDIEYTYEVFVDSTTWVSVPSISSTTSAGQYRVTATVAETDNYTGLISSAATFSITQATYPKEEYNIIRGKKFVYNGTEQPMRPMEIICTEGKYTYCWEEDGEFTGAYPRKKDVGVYTAYYKFTPNDTNYKVVTGTVELTITKATNTWTTPLTIEGWTYGDEPNAPSAVSKFGNEDIEYTYEVFVDSTTWVSVPSISSTTSAGQYRVTATVAETDNYTGLTSSAATFNIQKATNEWTTEPTIEGWKYGDTPNLPVAVAKFGNEHIAYTYEVFVSRTKWAFVPSITSTTSAGQYRVTVAIAETDNYTLLTKTVTFSITKATNTWTTEPSIANWMYGNEPSTPVGAARFGEVTFKYGTSTDVSTATDTVPTNAGTYYLFASVAGTSNYDALQSETFEFTIQKRLIKAVKTSKEYDGTDQIHVGADGFELFNNAGTSGVISGDEVYMTFFMETADVGSEMKNRTDLQGAAASNYDLPDYDMYILPQITPRTLNNFAIDGSPDGTNSGAGAGQYAGKWYYEHTLVTSDTTCLLSGDEVKVRIWFANENDMIDYMTASEITLVNSMDLIEEGTAFIEIYGGADGNNYQIGTTDLGIYVAGN